MGYITRKPIINKDKEIYAYKLLADKDVNIKECINYLLPLNDKKIFVNFKYNQLYNEITRHKPRKTIGVELNENLINTEIYNSLSKSGFIIITNFYHENLAKLINIMKLNYSQILEEKKTELITKCKNKNIKLMACNLNNDNEFKKAISEGFDFFQGNFYITSNYSRNDLPAFKINYFKLLQQINQTEPDFNEIENIIKNDLSLSYNLFRLINSAYFGLKNEIKSIKHALTLLGLNDFKKWLSIKIMRDLSEDRPNILMEKTLIRAHFAENLSLYVDLKEKKFDLFVLGLFSLIDIFLKKPLPEIIGDLSLSPKVKDALLKRKGKLGIILNLIIAHEQGNWSKVNHYLDELNIKQDKYMKCYCFSLESTQKALQAF